MSMSSCSDSDSTSTESDANLQAASSTSSRGSPSSDATAPIVGSSKNVEIVDEVESAEPPVNVMEKVHPNARVNPIAHKGQKRVSTSTAAEERDRSKRLAIAVKGPAPGAIVPNNDPVINSDDSASASNVVPSRYYKYAGYELTTSDALKIHANIWPSLNHEYLMKNVPSDELIRDTVTISCVAEGLTQNLARRVSDLEATKRKLDDMVTHLKHQNSAKLKMYEDKKELKEAKATNAEIAKDFLSLKEDVAKVADVASKKQRELQDRVNELTRDLDASRKDTIDAEARGFTRGIETPLSRERKLEVVCAFFQSPVFTVIGDRRGAVDVQDGFQLAIDQLTHLGGIAEGFDLRTLDITKRGNMTDEPADIDDDIITVGDDFELVLGKEQLFMANTGIVEVRHRIEESEIVEEDVVGVDSGAGVAKSPSTVPTIPAIEVDGDLAQFSNKLISDLLSDENVGAINVPIEENSLDDEEELKTRPPLH